MAVSKGKKFEECLYKGFMNTFKSGTINRIYDTQGYRKGVKNVCDYIGYNFPNIYYLEAKSLHGNTFSIQKLTQYDALAEKQGIKGVVAGVVIWFIDHKRVVFVDINKVTELIKLGKKSINIKFPEDYSVELDTTIKRVYPEINFSKLGEYSKHLCI